MFFDKTELFVYLTADKSRGIETGSVKAVLAYHNQNQKPLASNSEYPIVLELRY